MTGYSPTYIKGNQTGLVQNREEFILPNDAYPVLENAYVWRERIVRKRGSQLLGRLRRVESDYALITMFSSAGAGNVSYNLPVSMQINISQPNLTFEPGNITPISIVIGAPISQTLTDTTGDGIFVVTGIGPIDSAKINYSTGILTIHYTGVAAASTGVFNGAYFPNLPVMGLRSRELNNINNEQMVAFDTIYAYIFAGTGFEEFIPGTTWTGSNSNFFWSTNYWVGDGDLKIFWVTNFSGTGGDPIRYTNGVAWVDFAPQIDASGNLLTQCLALLPFRGRMLAFNTLEGATLGTSVAFKNRIRWAKIGNPFTTAAPGVVTTVVPNAWRDDIRGNGGFLDIPTSEDIVSVGFVRDNLVIYCERSTWQLRYTGRSIAPFQIEKVNSELGAESTFSAVQFDTSLVGIGDKGVVECDSFKSERIDIKIPDLVFEFNNDNEGPTRVHGIRDLQQKLAYWTYPYKPSEEVDAFFPNRRLVYNYENDSWAIFIDSFTCFGTYQPQSGRTWADFDQKDEDEWENCNFPWINRPSLFPSIMAGNQQGFVLTLGGNLQGFTSNSKSLYIKNITGNVTSVTSINSPSHNLETGQVIKILNIPDGTPFASSLNGNIFGVVRTDSDNFTIYKYSSQSELFDIPQIDPDEIYIGNGSITVRDNFSIVSKKFNFLEEGQNIQIGFIDILMNNTSEGAISLRIYNDYNDNTPTNIYPENSQRDTFFNTVVPTTADVQRGSSKNWIRVFCPTRAAFLTIEWTLSNAQLNGQEQESDVQIDAQILWTRKAGTQLPIGI